MRKRKGMSLCLLLTLLVSLCIPFSGSARGINLVLQKEVEASSEWSDTYSAAMAVDGDPGTRWSAAKEDISNSWIQVDFGQSEPFDSVLLSEYSQRISSFTIEASTDGKTWEEVYSGESVPVTTITFDKVSARYIKINILEASESAGFWDIEVYDSTGTVPPNYVAPAPNLGNAMIFDSVDGPLTSNEMDQIKAYAKEKIPNPQNNYTPGRNDYAYGTTGAAFDALTALYAATGDVELLDILINWADYMINSRNDMPGGEQRVYWDDQVFPVWPNEPPDVAKTPDSEQGDIVGKLYYLCLLIYKTPNLQDKEVPFGDTFGYGKTYAERAQTYIDRCDETMDEYIIPYFLNQETLQICYPTDQKFWTFADSSTYGGSSSTENVGRLMISNRQFMVAHAFQRSAELNEFLGNTEKAELYHTITQKSLESFENSLIPATGREDMPTVIYNYWPTDDDHIEDLGHASFDMIGYWRMLKSGRYTSQGNNVELVCNNILYLISAGDGTFAENVQGDMPDSPTTSLQSKFMFMAEFDPDIMTLITPSYISNARTKVDAYGTILYLKAMLYGVEGFEAKPVDIYANAAAALEESIVLQIANSTAMVNGSLVKIDPKDNRVAPLLWGNKTLLPVRFVSENLGAKVSFDNSTGVDIVTVVQGDKTIVMELGKNEIMINGTAQAVEEPAQIIGDRTFLPVRDLCEALGMSVYWGDSEVIIITQDAYDFTDEDIQSVVSQLAG